MAFLIGGANSAAADTAYDIDNSLRVGNDHYLTRTFTEVTAERKKHTMSCWAKRNDIGSENHLLYSYQDGDNYSYIRFHSGNVIKYTIRAGGATVAYCGTYAVYRDPSAWYHVVLVYDSAQATDTNRVKIYINNVQQSTQAETWPTLNLESVVGDDCVHTIAPSADGGLQVADWYYIGNQALTPSSFGETDEDSGIWKPKEYSGTFGSTNDTFLEFKQTGTNQDSSGMGADTSGEDNHWAVTNLAATDQTTDTPTNNFATFNPLMTFADMVSGTDNTLLWTEGNTTVTGETSGTPYVPSVGSIGVSSGKWYYEFYTSTTDSGTKICGAMNYDFTADGDKDMDDASYAVRASSGTLYYNGSTSDPSGTGEWKDDGDILSIALNMDDSEISWAINGGSYVAAQTISGNAIASGTMHPVAWVGDDEVVTVNFGNPNWALSSGVADENGYGAFEYAPPSGYYALCTKNLAEFG